MVRNLAGKPRLHHTAASRWPAENLMKIGCVAPGQTQRVSVKDKPSDASAGGN